MKNGVTVTRKYLEVGHTFMEGDSVHSKIEKKLKHKDINVPADYISIIKNARVRPFPMKSRMINSYHNPSSRIMKQWLISKASAQELQ